MSSFSDLARTTLSGNISSSVATIPVASTARFDDSGYLNIEDELIAYTGKTSTSFTGCTRGVGYPVVTAQAGHLNLVLVRAVVTAAQLLAMIQNPMTNPGDTITGGTAGAATAVAAGADGEIWKVDPSTHLPAWLSAGDSLVMHLAGAETATGAKLFNASLIAGWDLRRSGQTWSYAASITPDAWAGEIVQIGALTGNITINAPTNSFNGQELTFWLTQDATGGRTVAWNAVFLTSNWSMPAAANAVGVITFFYRGANWIRKASAPAALPKSVQTIAYAATITPDPGLGSVVVVTLTGNITIANPPVSLAGQELTLELIQDLIGTRTTTFGSHFKTNWTPTITAGLRNVIGFVYDGAAWVQTSAVVGLPGTVAADFSASAAVAGTGTKKAPLAAPLTGSAAVAGEL